MPVKILELSGKRWAIMPEGEYKRMAARAVRVRRNSGEVRSTDVPPEFPAPDSQGHYPALEYARVSLARKIIAARRQAGLSQAELTQHAVIKPEILDRIERGKTTPDAPTVGKIQRALRQARKRTD